MSRIYTWMRNERAADQRATRRAERDRIRAYDAEDKKREHEMATSGRIGAHIGGARPGVIRQVGGHFRASHDTFAEYAAPPTVDVVAHRTHPNDTGPRTPTDVGVPPEMPAPRPAPAARTPAVDYTLTAFVPEAYVDLFGFPGSVDDAVGPAAYRTYTVERTPPTTGPAARGAAAKADAPSPTKPRVKPEAEPAVAQPAPAAGPLAVYHAPEWELTYPAGALLLGNVNARGSCMIGSSAQMAGALSTGGALAIGDHATISGPIQSAGHITVGAGVELGPVRTRQGITAAPSPTIHLHPKRFGATRADPAGRAGPDGPHEVNA